MSAQGIVYLVGAGPGDPGLLTLRAFELIRSAEVVAHDELVSPEILSLVSFGAELLAVGRRHGRGKIDYRLHPLVLERARAGRVVVRLKSGDPLIFGRGAEEAEELANAGIPFEIVPGVSAALGAAAYAGIPLTHRHHASRVTLTTGRRAEPGGRTNETVVLYMAARRLPENIERLLQTGHAPSTPAAYIAAATTPRQTVITGTLAELASQVQPGCDSDPALVIVGDTTRLRERIGWFERAPLHGRRLLVARARPGPSQIAARLRAMGALVLEKPKVSIQETACLAALERALRKDHYDAIVFGCSVGVDLASKLFRAIDSGSSCANGTRVIAIGRAASAALRKNGIPAFLQLDGACREATAKAAYAFAGKRLLLVASAQGRPNLKADLETAGARVEEAPIYQQSYEYAAELLDTPELIVLPSSSAARLLLTGEDRHSLVEIPMIAIGPVTEAAAKTLGAVDVKRCDADNIDSIVAAVRATLGASGGGGFERDRAGDGVNGCR
jgi:uroporphyrinogen III methyltransferase/synthase